MKQDIVCHNVFKSTDKNLLKREFERIIIELINQLEKSKGTMLS